jgi:hypothetical protein
MFELFFVYGYWNVNLTDMIFSSILRESTTEKTKKDILELDKAHIDSSSSSRGCKHQEMMRGKPWHGILQGLGFKDACIILVFKYFCPYQLSENNLVPSDVSPNCLLLSLLQAPHLLQQQKESI